MSRCAERAAKIPKLLGAVAIGASALLAASVAAAVETALWGSSAHLAAFVALASFPLSAFVAAKWAGWRARRARTVLSACMEGCTWHRLYREVTCRTSLGRIRCLDLGSGEAYEIDVQEVLGYRRVSILDPIPYYCVGLLAGKARDGYLEGELELFWLEPGVIARVKGRAKRL